MNFAATQLPNNDYLMSRYLEQVEEILKSRNKDWRAQYEPDYMSGSVS